MLSKENTPKGNMYKDEYKLTWYSERDSSNGDL